MIKYGLSMLSILLISHMLSGGSSSADTNLNLGRKMWSAFECATYAELSGNTSEQERLFKVGLTAGKDFVEGARNKTITDAEVENAPVAVVMRMGGPSTDFVIGRVFEAAAEYAFDKVVKEDSTGSPIYDPTKWARDEVKVISAKAKYFTSNCTLIR